MSVRTFFTFCVLACAVLCAGCTDAGERYGSTGPSCAVAIPSNWSAGVTVFMDGEETAFLITAADDGRYLAEFSNGTIVSDDGRRHWTYHPAGGRAEVVPSMYAGAVWNGAGRPVRAMLYALDLLQESLSDGNVTCTRTDGRIEIAGDGILGFAPTRMHDAVERIALSVDPKRGEIEGLTLLDPAGRGVMAVTFEDFTEVVLPADAFSFAPPEGTAITLMRTYAVTPIHAATLEAAERCFDVPLPHLPGEYAFIGGSCLPAFSTIMVYQKNGTTFSITVRPADLPDSNPPEGQAQRLLVNGLEGAYYGGTDTNALIWTENTTAFRIEGMADKEEMMLVAASFGTSGR